MESQRIVLSQLIVIADDDPVVRHILTSILSSQGYEVKAASNGAECIQITHELQSSETAPAAFFVDMFLGDMNGLEVLHQIRAAYVENPPPVIMLSANPKEEALVVDRSIEPDDYLEKPFTGPVVIERLQRMLARAA